MEHSSLFLDTALVTAKTRSFGQAKRLVGIQARPAAPLTGFALDLSPQRVWLLAGEFFPIWEFPILMNEVGPYRPHQKDASIARREGPILPVRQQSAGWFFATGVLRSCLTWARKSSR